MAFTKPGFFTDWARHGLGAAWGKRFGSLTIGGTTYSYESLVGLPWPQLVGVFQQAAAERQELATCYCFEVMLVQTQNTYQCLHTVIPLLLQMPGDFSGPTFRRLLGYVKSNEELALWIDLGGRQVSYESTLVMGWNDVAQVFDTSVSQGQNVALRWAFEAMLAQTAGDFWRCWGMAVEKLEGKPENAALVAMRELVAFVPNEEELKTRDHSFFVSYLLGKVYLEQTEEFRGSNKEQFLSRRPMAMHFLKAAREKSEEARMAPSADPYRQAAMVAATAAAAAAAYETVFYMAYKGTRDVSMSSNE